MTEAEWLASEDPKAMLDRVTTWSDTVPGLHPSVRKLALFGCACRRRLPHAPHPNYDDMEAGIFPAGYGMPEAVSLARAWCEEFGIGEGSTDFSRLGPPLAERAALLREVIGNPFRPLPYYHFDGRLYPLVPADVPMNGGRFDPIPWLTPTVVTLAQSAYDERRRKCEDCHGTGNGYHVRDHHIHSPPEDFCTPCRGTGTVGDGTLDPLRLCILADALEDAGCGDEAILGHLRTAPSGEHSPRCGTAFRGCAPECPKDRWEKNGPHVRGCWALDLLLGKE